jgi:DNA polymerase-3 subunit alpha
MSFVHAHIRTQFSILDSTLKIQDLVDHIKALRMPAVGIADIHTLSGVVQFSKACAEQGIKPLMGAQVSILSQGSMTESLQSLRQKDAGATSIFLSKLILYPKSGVGYRNLSRLLTAAQTFGRDAHPKIDKDLLESRKRELICVMPMETGEWIEWYRKGQTAAIESSLTFYLETFGDDFYVELIRPVEYALLTSYEQHLMELRERFAFKIIATNAACYLHPTDCFAWRVVSAISQGIKIGNVQEESLKTGFRDVCSAEEMQDRFRDFPEALEATVELANKIKFDFDFNKPRYKKAYHLPHPPIPEGESVDSYFKNACHKGLEKRFEQLSLSQEQRAVYQDRLKNEIQVITGMNFCGYFLIVADFIQQAKSRGIPVGPGRGSGAGSLAAYALMITDLDPIHHGLLFERFLNPERISLPDFDIDFCMERRPEVINYVVEKYGSSKVAQIITFGKLQARMVLRDVGRVFGYSHAEMDQIAKLVPEILGISLKQAIEKEPTLQNLINKQPMTALLFEIASKLEGLVRHASVHAAGLVIANKPLDNYCPLYAGRDGVITTQLDMNDLEQIGLVKFDFLGLKTLTQLDLAQKDIQAKTGAEDAFAFRVDRLPLNDAQTYELLGRGDTLGVFQLESPGMQDLCKKLKPDSFDDITAINALFRPGPLGSGMVDDFIQRKHGNKKTYTDLPQLEPILKETYGVIVYQEQVQKLAVELAGYSLGAADILRRAMGKKKPEEMAKQRSLFLAGAKSRNIPSQKAEHLFDLMAKFAEYGFNKSHAAAYALISYQTAYLKTHYPAQFYASLLTIEINFTDKLKRYIDDAKAHGIHVLPPNVNESQKTFQVVDERHIRFGLLGIKGLGVAALENILEERSRGLFTSLRDFCKRIDLQKVNKRVLEALIKSGSFDFTQIPRAKLFDMIESVMTHAAHAKDQGCANQASLFGTQDSDADQDTKLASTLESTWDPLTLAGFERDHLGCYLTVHPFDAYDGIRKKLDVKAVIDCFKLPQRKEVRLFGILTKLKKTSTKQGDTRLLLTCEDRSGVFEATCLFDNPIHHQAELLKIGHLYVFLGKLDSVFQGRLRITLYEPNHIQKLDDHLADWSKFLVQFCFRGLPEGKFSSNYALTLKQLMTKHAGVSPVRIWIHAHPDGEIFLQIPGSGIKISPEFIEESRKILGPDSVHITYQK